MKQAENDLKEGLVSNKTLESKSLDIVNSMLVNYDDTKRQGSFSIYLEPWHAEIESFLDPKKGYGLQEARARSLSMAVVLSNLFMKRVSVMVISFILDMRGTKVQDDGPWSLFHPNQAPGLSESHGSVTNDSLFMRCFTVCVENLTVMNLKHYRLNMKI